MGNLPTQRVLNVQQIDLALAAEPYLDDLAAKGSRRRCRGGDRLFARRGTDPRPREPAELHRANLLTNDSAERMVKCRELVTAMRSVDWRRGKPWEGIAGKFTTKGAFSLGDPKETAHAIYGALTNPASDGYKRIRPGIAVAA